MIDVREFIAGYIDRPFSWGSDDCSLFVADWWLANHGADPAIDIRGTYASEEDKTALVTRAGGLLALVNRCAVSVRAIRTKSPIDGDFGVISTGGDMFAAICVGDMWAIRSETGIAFTSAVKVVRAWSV